MKLEILFCRTPDRRDTDRRGTDENRDPISGARGAHPVGTGVGAAAGGAATGAAVGSVAGPVGTAAGIVGGAIVGGLIGKGVAEQVNPTAEREYWSTNYNREPYYEAGRTFEDYDPAYRVGYEGYSRYGRERKWDECELDLRKEYEKNRGKSPFTWDQARPAARAAWDRANRGIFERYIGHHVVDRDEEVIGKLASIWTDEAGQPAYLGVKTSWFSGKHHVLPAHSAHIDPRRERIRVPFSVQAVKDAPHFDPDCELSDADESSIESYYAGFGSRAAGAGATGKAGKTEMTSRPAAATGAVGRRPGEQAESASMTLNEEKLKVGKREVEAGGVRLRKIIRTETVNRPVELRREEIAVERVPASQGTGASAQAFQEGDIYVPLRREEAVVEKETNAREEVRVRKDSRSEQQNVSGQVRREDVEIERQGEAKQGPGREKR